MTSIRHVSFRQLGSGSEIQTRYLEQAQELESLLGRRPTDVDDLLKRAPGPDTRRLVRPEALGEVLLNYAERHGAGQASLDVARSLGPDVQFVITGQQPGLFGGPLYSLHKVATAVRLARELNERVAETGGPPRRILPLFWNHTDDHDLDEVNRAFLLNQNLDLQRVRLDIDRTGESIRDIPVGRAMESALAAAKDLLPASEFREQVLEAFRPRHPDESFGAGMARLLFELFGESGLLILEPRELPAEAFEVLPRWREQAGTIRETMRQNAEHLVDLGLDATLDPTATLMFHHQAHQRTPLDDGDETPAAESLSPGAVLRPLWQDACLPTLAFVVGPGELSYLAVAGPLYQKLGVPQSLLVPRASLTLVEPSLNKLLQRFEWDLPDLAHGVEELAASLEESGDGGPEGRIEQLEATVRAEMAEVARQLKSVDPAMVGPVDRTRSKLSDELGKLAGKVKRSRQNRAGTGVRQIRRLCNNLRPRGRLQERVLTALPFLVAHGPELANVLVEAADPFSVDHIIVVF